MRKPFENCKKNGTTEAEDATSQLRQKGKAWEVAR